MQSPLVKPQKTGLPTWKKLLFSGTVFAVCLAVVEVGMRATLGEPWYLKLVKQQTIPRLGTVPIGDRPVVLRRPPPGTPKPSGTLRILFLGDSFTYGAGLSDPTQTFVRRIERRLNDDKPRPEITRYEAFNGGIPGSMTDQWVGLLDHLADGYQPDLVVVVFFLRDGVANVTSMGQIRQIRQELRDAHDGSVLFRWSRLYRLFRERQLQVRLSDQYLSKLRDGYLGDSNSTAEWRRAQQNLKRLRDRASAMGSRFAVTVFPLLFQLDEGYPLQAVCEEIEAFCRRHDMPVHSLLPAFLGHRAESLWVSPLNQHPNAEAHTIAADALYGFVVSQVR